MEIENSFLMWVGSEHYATIEDYTGEMVIQGISKRVQSLGVAEKLTKPNTVVFVAHDEGKTHDCKKCVTDDVACPPCRKCENEISDLIRDVVKSKMDRDKKYASEKDIPKGVKRFIRVREAHIARFKKEMKDCKRCSGTGTFKGGSGGQVSLESGQQMDYREYNYWLHQPKKFDVSTVRVKNMCAPCGGLGTLPDAKLFGLFVPDRIEYILKGDETEKKMERMKAAGVVFVDDKTLKAELKRKCGRRQPGGTYVVSSVSEGTDDPRTEKMKEVLGKLKESGAVIDGCFVRFPVPIGIKAKRFRGIKRVKSVPAAAKKGARMILDAME